MLRPQTTRCGRAEHGANARRRAPQRMPPQLSRFSPRARAKRGGRRERPPPAPSPHHRSSHPWPHCTAAQPCPAPTRVLRTVFGPVKTTPTPARPPAHPQAPVPSAATPPTPPRTQPMHGHTRMGSLDPARASVRTTRVRPLLAPCVQKPAGRRPLAAVRMRAVCERPMSTSQVPNRCIPACRPTCL